MRDPDHVLLLTVHAAMPAAVLAKLLVMLTDELEPEIVAIPSTNEYERPETMIVQREPVRPERADRELRRALDESAGTWPPG